MKNKPFDPPRDYVTELNNNDPDACRMTTLRMGALLEHQDGKLELHWGKYAYILDHDKARVIKNNDRRGRIERKLQRFLDRLVPVALLFIISTTIYMIVKGETAHECQETPSQTSHPQTIPYRD